MDKIEPEFLSIKEASVVFSVTEVTIRRAIQKGFLIAIRIGDGKKSPYRISKKAIEDIHALIIMQHRQKGKK
jgi:excisionase family DNA binding protein